MEKIEDLLYFDTYSKRKFEICGTIFKFPVENRVKRLVYINKSVCVDVYRLINLLLFKCDSRTRGVVCLSDEASRTL